MLVPNILNRSVVPGNIYENTADLEFWERHLRSRWSILCLSSSVSFKSLRLKNKQIINNSYLVTIWILSTGNTDCIEASVIASLAEIKYLDNADCFSDGVFDFDNPTTATCLSLIKTGWKTWMPLDSIRPCVKNNSACIIRADYPAHYHEDWWLIDDLDKFYSL